MSAPLRTLLNLAIVAGIVLMLWPLGQTLYGRASQFQLAREFDRENQRAKGRVPAAAPKGNKAAPFPGVANTGTVNKGKKATKPPPYKWPSTKLLIPSIELESYVVGSLTAGELRKGPGHDPKSSMPGGGNCVIAGHRNIYGSPFLRVDELQTGDEILLQTPKATHRYAMARVFTTSDQDLNVLRPPAAGQPTLLTLITCTIPHTNDRIVVQAHLKTSIN